MRPQSLSDIVGQKDLPGKGKLLDSMLESGMLPALILWGPPGTGKTTLARILARSTTAHFVYFSAVLSGVKEVRKIVAQAEKSLTRHGSDIRYAKPATARQGNILLILTPLNKKKGVFGILQKHLVNNS